MTISQQSGAIPYLCVHNGIQLVLVTSRTTGAWIFPKGDIEPEMTPAESAANEALEEAGVLGEVAVSEVASYEYEKWSGRQIVSMFPLRVEKVLDHWDEMDSRERQIISPIKARGMIDERLLSVLDAFERSLSE